MIRPPSLRLLQPSSLHHSLLRSRRIHATTITTYPPPRRLSPSYPHAHDPIPPPRSLSSWPSWGTFIRIGIYIGFFGTTGYETGKWIISALLPDVPVRGSEEEAAQLVELEKQLDNIMIVKEMRKEPETWREHEAYSSLAPEARPHRFTTGPLGGAGGIGPQRVWVDARSGRAIAVVWLGPDLSGWPAVVHGGAIATLMDESMGRVAIAKFPARTVPVAVTATLKLAYKSPTLTGNWYVIWADALPDSTPTKARVKAVLAAMKDEYIEPLVEAEGLFVVPKGLRLRAIKEGF